MRRTYRSKKDTGGVLDRRDLLLNLDEKSSAYDAFFIQNIKETKREISCIGSSNAYGVAPNRVRKRKYVRRIVKGPETPYRESLSQSAYLTPNKSIRVNKPMDPFDMLLNSSNACTVQTIEPKVESLSSQVDIFDKLLKHKEEKTYTRKRTVKPKKVNYSNSESSDSDKENSDEHLRNVTQNTSDIKAYQLLIESEAKDTPKRINDSINNIVNNISLINRLKHKNSLNDSMKRSHFNKNRLTRNIQSPILQKSPLCSTPFKVKYRGESIFKFSPICVSNDDESPKYTTIIEDNDDCSDKSIILFSSDDKRANNSKEKSIPPIENILSPINRCDSVLIPEKDSEIPREIKENSNIEISSLQTTELEPFMGFSNVALDNKADEINLVILNCDDSVSQNDVTEIENDDSQHTADENQKNDSLFESDDDKISLYESCTSDQSSINEKHIKQPVVQIKRMNDSSFMRYYVKKKVLYSDGEESNDSKSNILDTDSGDANDSIEEYCNSFKDTESNNNEESIEDLSLDEEFASFDNSTASNAVTETDSNENELNSDSLLNEADNNYVISSNEDDDGELNETEKCISFVTTRRKNEVTNTSLVSSFNDSYGSSSSNCDKTVLSYNKDNKIILDDNDTLKDLSMNDTVTDEIAELNTDVMCQEVQIYSSSNDEEIDNSTRISFITDKRRTLKRKSSTTSKMNTVSCRKSSIFLRDSRRNSPECSRRTSFEKPGIVLQPGKKWERSLSIYRRMTMTNDHFDESVLEDEPMESKGRKYRQSVISTMVMQDLNGSLHNESINSRRSTFVSKPSRSTIRIVKDPDISRLSICSTTEFDDLKGFLNEECDDTVIELSKLSIADQTHEVTVLDNFHDSSNRLATARGYVLRRCNQADAILFDECYPDSVLKNCHKIGEGVYGEVFLWRDRDGRARVLKIVPIAGTLKVNGESQKDFHEIISEIVIAMELSALRAPIAEINRHFDEGKDVEALDLHSIENATDIFNEVLAVRCVYGSYPARLLDLWDLYDECKGSENDNPAILPADQQYIVLELANAGQDLESYQFNNAEQAYALFLQVAYGLAVAEEAFQFEHRDLHWGNVLIAPTEEKYTTFVLRGRSHRVARGGVAATIIDYSLSRLALPLARGDAAALYNDLAADDSLFDAVGDYQFQVYRLMRDKLGNDWKNFEPYTNILWLHYTVDKMITALRYKRTNTKIHKHYIEKLKGIKNRILDYGSAALFVLTDSEI